MSLILKCEFAAGKCIKASELSLTGDGEEGLNRGLYVIAIICEVTSLLTSISGFFMSLDNSVTSCISSSPVEEVKFVEGFSCCLYYFLI